MKRLLCLLFAISLLLTGCNSNTSNTPSNSDGEKHSVYYADRVSVDKMAYYFNDVCFSNEYDVHAKQTVVKWQDPIMLYIDGVATMTDYEVLNNFLDFLNNIEGFPGIMQIHDKTQANLVIHFLGLAQFRDEVPVQDAIGYASYNYNNATSTITDGDVFILTDTDQTERNSVILEEVYQILGPTKDTLVRKDSIIYQRGNVEKLSDVDKSIMRLLYCERITPGMTMTQSEEIIREIYY